MADRVLFGAPHFRALQNLGGIGNVTVVPPEGSAAPVRAFDTGPGVVVIDGVTRFVNPALRYDLDGALARQGSVIESVVREAMGDPYFSAPPPKSTGREYFDAAYIRSFVDVCRRERPGASDADVVATAVAVTVASVADSYRRFVPEPLGDIVVSGGGAKNPVLRDGITRALAPVRVVTFDELFFDGEAKEAVAFALLGYLHLSGESGNVPSATGARGERVLGKLTPR